MKIRCMKELFACKGFQKYLHVHVYSFVGRDSPKGKPKSRATERCLFSLRMQFLFFLSLLLLLLLLHFALEFSAICFVYIRTFTPTHPPMCLD